LWQGAIQNITGKIMNTNIPFNRGTIRPAECISQGWELIKDRYWLFFGMVLLGMVIAGCIPCAGALFAGPIAVGLYYSFFTQMRRQPVEFNMMFKGFEKFVPAMLLGLIEAVPGILAQIFRVVVQVGDAVTRQGGRASSNSDIMPALAGGILIVALIGGLGFMLFAIAWHITFRFGLPLITEHDLTLSEAIKLSARAGWSNVGGIILLSILEGLVVLAGIIALCVGFFFVLPILWAANAIAYRMVFPEPAQQQNVYNEPPRPDYYGGSFGQGA
jgi:hypothetical protein